MLGRSQLRAYFRKTYLGKIVLLLRSVFPEIWSNTSLVIYVQDLRDAIRSGADGSIEFEVRRSNQCDIEQIQQNRLDGREILRRTENGHLCFVAQNSQGEIIGYIWIAFDEIYIGEILKTMALTSGEAFLYDVFVFPKYRKRGVYKQLLRTTCGWLRQRGFMNAYCGALASNVASRSGLERVGFKEEGTVTLVRVLGRKRYDERWKSAKVHWKQEMSRT